MTLILAKKNPNMKRKTLCNALPSDDIDDPNKDDRDESSAQAHDVPIEGIEKIAFPHDMFFKESLRHAAIAKDFFQHNLPTHVLERVNLSTLSLEPVTFTDKKGKSSFKDIVYSVEINDSPGKLFALCEHQSRVDPWMALRIQAYLMDFFEHCVKQGAKQLPPVVCCVFYHGTQSPYPYSCDFLDLFEDKAWAKRQLQSPFHLIDLTQKSDDELLNHGKASILEVLQKNIRTRDIRLALDKLRQHGCFSLDVEFGDYLKFVVKYIIQEGDAPNKQALIQSLSEALPEQERHIMTIAQQLIQEGREQGLEQGVRQGSQQSLQQVARRMLDKGVSKEEIKIFTLLSTEEIDDLAH